MHRSTAIAAVTAALLALTAVVGTALAQDPYSPYYGNDGYYDDGRDANQGYYGRDDYGNRGVWGDGPSGQGYYDYAQVLEVAPIIVPGQPRYRQQCWREPAGGGYYNAGYDRGHGAYGYGAYGHDRRGYDDRGYRRSSSDVAAPLLGAVIGGALGNQVGGGDGRTAATIVGAVLGAAIGNDSQRRSYGSDHYGYQRAGYGGGTIERCQTVADRGGYDDRVVGYNVTYQYHGQVLHTRSNAHPGDRIRVRVDVQPEV